MIYIIEIQYFGNINYNKIIYNSSYVKYEIYEKYKKSTYRNKMELPGSNGVLELSIPIVGGRDTKAIIKDIAIDYTESWQSKHYKAIFSIYKNSPWFEHYENSLYELYQRKPVFLWQWNKLCVEWVQKQLKSNVIMLETESYINKDNNEIEMDYRSVFEKKTSEANQNESIKYYQVFEDRIGYQPNMCILDLLFCEGPNAFKLLNNI